MRFIPKLAIAAVAVNLLTGWGARGREPEWPHAGPMPDDPVAVKPLRYQSITEGLKSYRPIEPMPWGDVNRRVAPPGSLPGAPPAVPGGGAGSGSGNGAATKIAPNSAVPAKPVAVPAAPGIVPPVPRTAPGPKQ